MACGKLAFFLFAILASSIIALAEEGSESNPSPNKETNERYSFSIPFYSMNMGSGAGELPSLGQLFGSSGNGSSNPFGSFLSAFSQFLPNSNSSNQNSSRQEQVHPDLESDDHQDRLFFGSLFGVPVACNYTTQAGLTCAGCRERLTCGSNNIGRLRVCSSFLAPYCNNGRCSFFPGSACNSTSNSTSG